MASLNEIVQSVEGLTRAGWDRRMATAEACVFADQLQLEGAFVECGTWKGAHGIIAAKVSTRSIWLYDTFEGMTEPGPEDGPKARQKWDEKKRMGIPFTRCSLENVKHNLAAHGIAGDQVKLVKGDVRETLKRMDLTPAKVAVLRLDVDWYDATKACLELLYPKLVENGIIIMDDYGHWEGARKAVDEYLPGMLWSRIDYTGVHGVKRC